MKLQRKTGEQLHEFYEDLRAEAPQWDKCTSAMLRLLNELEATPPNDSFQVFTSHEALVFGDPDASECNVLVTAECDGFYRVGYALANSAYPWQWVVGRSADVVAAVKMIQFGLRMYGHGLPDLSPLDETSAASDGKPDFT